MEEVNRSDFSIHKKYYSKIIQIYNLSLSMVYWTFVTQSCLKQNKAKQKSNRQKEVARSYLKCQNSLFCGLTRLTLFKVNSFLFIQVGQWGVKRFKRDGYGCILEPKDTRFYPDGMTQKFENVESEWPLFYSFLIIDGVFKGLNEQVEKYQKFLKRRLIYTEKGGSNFRLFICQSK